MTGQSVQVVVGLLFGFIAQGQPLEPAAGDDRVYSHRGVRFALYGAGLPGLRNGHQQPAKSKRPRLQVRPYPWDVFFREKEYAV